MSAQAVSRAQVVPYGKRDNGELLFHAVCYEHPWFVRAPWTKTVIPLADCAGHNAKYHLTPADSN